jgi:hypothetical protein
MKLEKLAELGMNAKWFLKSLFCNGLQITIFISNCSFHNGMRHCGVSKFLRKSPLIQKESEDIN